MFYSPHRLQLGLIYLLLGIFAVLAVNPVQAQSTSSQIKVVVADQAGSFVDGVDVLVTHVPTPLRGNQQRAS